MNNKQEERKKRPLLITIICLYDFIILPIGICFFSLPFVKEYFSQQHTSDWILSLINLWLFAYFIVAIGLWRMKKWAGYIYILLLTYSIATNEFDLGSLLIKAICIHCIAKNISKMS